MWWDNVGNPELSRVYPNLSGRKWLRCDTDFGNIGGRTFFDCKFNKGKGDDRLEALVFSHSLTVIPSL